MNIAGPYYAQFREDRILEIIFHGKTSGVCVEVGAHDGITGSNTFLFEKKGWKCVLVEPIPELCEKIRQCRSGFLVNCAASSSTGEASFHVANSIDSWSALDIPDANKERLASGQETVREITVRTRKLDDILEEAGVHAIDFLSIDVEGHELEVLRGLSIDRFTPRILIVEDNQFPSNADVSGYLTARGYRSFLRTGVNEWYGRNTDPILRPECVSRWRNLSKQRPV
jgi:FkbM family methyltransferase